MKQSAYGLVSASLFKSKFDRDSDFKTPVAVFILQIELYAVTRGLATVSELEQTESINSAFLDGVFGQLIAAVIEMETGLCRRGHPRLRCAVFLGTD